MKCKVCGNYVRLLRSGAVATHLEDEKVICPASGVGPGHPDHPDPLTRPDVTWEELDRGYIDWPEPDQTYGAADWVPRDKKGVTMNDKDMETRESTHRIRVWPIRWQKLHFAVRWKWTNFSIGFALDWETQPWFTLRLGPLHFDVAYGKRPHWS